MKARRIVALWLAIMVVLAPCLARAGTTLPGIFGRESASLPAVAAQALPTVRAFVQGIDKEERTANSLTVYQNQSKAIADWNTFNIGSDASVYFNQQGNSSWAVLNRIWDQNPSQIYGRLGADGKVFLINQNGILFGPGSQVNVNTLIAGTLNISNANFLSDTLRFTAGNYSGATSWYDSVSNIPGAVSNHGHIATQDAGSVFLIGSTVENNGTIISPSGQIGLIAGTDVELALPVSGTSILRYPGGEARTAKVVKVYSSPEGSLAWNMEGGSLVADTGLVGMYGNIVNHDGLICSATAVRTAGHVELFAAKKITTGANSLILLPVLIDSEAVSTTFETARSDVTFGGLDPDKPARPTINVEAIEHAGIIDAPSGLVTMSAIDRVYLASGSLIDVSGLWLDYSGSANLLQVTLTTANLADEYSQKGGLLQGETIRISSLSGSAIGDVSEAYTAEGTTNMERHIRGGDVVINVAGNTEATPATRTATGDIIIMDGAVIDFSGGGINYGSGYLDTTKLVLGNGVYDISSADSTRRYESILNDQTVTHSRFGIVEVYEGVYSAGGQQLLDYVQEHTVGSDAGSLTLQGRQIVLDGTISGKATKGVLQTLASTDDETLKDYVEPKGGTLRIGNTEAEIITPGTTDFFTTNVVIGRSGSPVLPSGFTSDSVVAGSAATILPAATLSSAGLSTISIAANTGVTVERGAEVTMNAGGTFDVRARRIENYGTIAVPGGSINLNLEANKTTGTDGLSELIYLGPGSTLSVAGEIVDNLAASLLSGGISSSGHIDGGSIRLIDQTLKSFDTEEKKKQGQGVVIMPGALVDVSGGWQRSVTGKISGGDAGSLTLQGYSLVPAGDLRAWSLLGNEGGSITLHAYDVAVTNTAVSLPAGFSADSPWPSDLTGRLVFTSDLLDGTGFTNITLNAVRDLVVESGARIAPSGTKMTTPSASVAATEVIGLPNGTTLTTMNSGTGTFRAAVEEIGTTSVTLNAGLVPDDLVPSMSVSYPMNIHYDDARVRMSSASTIEVAPGGSVTVSAPYVDFAGTIKAPSGDVAATATYDLTLHNGARIVAEGYNKFDGEAQVEGLPLEYTVHDAGTVSLKAGRGLTLSSGSLISVSGSRAVANTSVVREDGALSLIYVSDAGQPGSIYLQGFSVDWQEGSILTGEARLAGLAGGTLSISQTNPLGTLSVPTSRFVDVVNAGFDALTLASSGVLELTGSGGATLGRSLTLSAPVIAGSGSDSIALSAPWVKVRNDALPSTAMAAAGDASIALSGMWLDVTGDVLFSGFENVYLTALRDMRLTDMRYTVDSSPVWSGLLRTSGDLTLTAGRIYPTILSDFTIKSAGKVTILPSGMAVNGPVYSAGGSLTIEAVEGIEHRGYIAAPMGSISLSATGSTGRVYLAEESITSTKGDAAVSYGSIVADLGESIWAVQDKANAASSSPYTVVEAAPEKSVSITGDEVIVREGAVIDISGGGSVFTYQFLESSAGTTNPLDVAGRYVIMPDNSIVLPGNAVYLAGGWGIAAGVYSLLPEEYAFLPGAMIITVVKGEISAGQTLLTKQGYTVVAGYETTMGTGITSQKYTAYEVRAAADVLREGAFEMQSATAGNAGRVSIAGNTTVVDGTINAAALAGYSGGSIVMSGTDVLVQANAVALPSGFGYDSAVPAGLAGKLNIAVSSLTGKGFETIGLGFTDFDDPSCTITALTVTLSPGVTLEAQNIILAARNIVTLGAGAQVLALAPSGKTGQVSLLSPEGSVVLAENSVVHASDAITLEAANLDIRGTLLADHSALNLKGSRITFVDDGYVRSSTDKGLFLTESLWNSFGIFENIALMATGLSVTGDPTQSISPDIVFNGDFSLSVAESLTLDAGLIRGLATGSTVVLSSETIRLMNSGDLTPVTTGVGTGQITFNAGKVEIGNGDILFNTFSSVNINALNDTVFRGEGSLQTGNGNLNISTARVTTSYHRDTAGSSTYQAANFKVDAGTGSVNIQGIENGVAGSSSTPGGTLEIAGQTIDVSTLIETPSGQLKLTASDDIHLDDGAKLLARGTAYAPGGKVLLTSTSGGSVILAEGGLIDVSAGSQGDAGSVAVYAPTGGATLAGELKGAARDGGTGGSFSLVTSSIDDFGLLNDKLYSGGFNETLNIRARAGSITIDTDDTVRAREVTLTTDGGSIDLKGVIDVSGTGKGGTAELNASGDLNIDGTILAMGTGTNADGGNVYLSVDGGMLNFNGGALIDVSGSGSGTGGIVTFRDPPPSDPPAFGDYQLMMSLAGTINGASSVTAVIDHVYQYSQITTAVMNTISSDITNFMNTYGDDIRTTLLSHLTGVDSSIFHLAPGVVIESAGNLTLSNDWNLSTWRYDGETGVLTLRAAGNLTLSGSILDNTGNTSTSYRTLRSSNAEPSWGINLIAGAALGSADIMAVVPMGTEGATSGTLTLSENKTVYTETGPVRFASGGNTVINDAPYNSYMITGNMQYSLATYTGSISGNVLGGLTIIGGGAIQSATGDIDITTGGDLVLAKSGSYTGTIRTTGEAPEAAGDYQKYYNFAGGGDIHLDVGGDVQGGLSTYWLTTMTDPVNRQLKIVIPTYSSALTTQTTEGIAAMAGGDVYVRSSGSIKGQVGTFGEGDLSVYSGGDLTGRFLIKEGTGVLNAMGNFGASNKTQLVEMSDARLTISAQGDVHIGAVLNPDLAAAAAYSYWDNGYTTASSVSITAATGDVTLYGAVDQSQYGVFYDGEDARNLLLPPTVGISAGRNITVHQGSGLYVLLPSATGNLTMAAGGDITFLDGARILVSDADPAVVFINPTRTAIPNLETHASVPVHLGDSVPIAITAGGSIIDMDITVPKLAAITAGQDIIDLDFSGQNITAGDVTSVIAGGSILYGYSKNVQKKMIDIGGPGWLIVEAGDSIDLGYTEGIKSVGNYANQALDPAGSSIIVAAGLARKLDGAAVEGFFNAVREAGKEYAVLNETDSSAAMQRIEKLRAEVIVPFLGFSGTSGDVNMTSSQISTTGGGSLFIIATGSVNVGKTVVSDNPDKSTGIFTSTGGAINVYANGDVNVNESRIMSFRGGDITVYSDSGDINAGKGSRAVISMSPPTYECKDGVCKPIQNIPAVGSGIRAMTYDPDGSGPLAEPEAGWLYVFAPGGVVDAGEAGMMGSGAFIGAVSVLNTANMSFAGPSVGVPAASQGTSLGALTGSTTLGDKTSGLSEDAAGLDKKVSRSVKPIEDAMKWVEVKVTGFDLNSPTAGGTEDET